MTKPSVGSTGLVINVRSLEMFSTHFFSSCMIMPQFVWSGDIRIDSSIWVLAGLLWLIRTKL